MRNKLRLAIWDTFCSNLDTMELKTYPRDLFWLFFEISNFWMIPGHLSIIFQKIGALRKSKLSQ